MATCHECGGPRVGSDGACLDCREARAELKIDPRRLDDAPEPDALPDPRAWGRGSDAPPIPLTRASSPPRRSRRNARPTTDRNAALKLDPEAEPDAEAEAEADAEALPDGRRSSGAEVVPLRRGSNSDGDRSGEGVPQGARPTPVAQRRPPVLASEALRKDLAPAAPAPAAIRTTAVALGLAGTLGCIAIAGATGLGPVLAGAFAAVAVVGLTPMTYASRAFAVVTLSGGALTLVTWGSARGATVMEPYVLQLGISMLATALIFRAWHRASLLARALTLLGITSCVGWLWMARPLATLTILDTHWQAWVPPVMQVPLALLLMLSLLAFMDSRSTGACGTWASLLLTWYVVFQWGHLLALLWPRGTSAFDAARVDPQLASAHFAQPLLTVLLVVGLAQLLAVANAPKRR